MAPLPFTLKYLKTVFAGDYCLILTISGAFLTFTVLHRGGIMVFIK